MKHRKVRRLIASLALGSLFTATLMGNGILSSASSEGETEASGIYEMTREDLEGRKITLTTERYLSGYGGQVQRRIRSGD